MRYRIETDSDPNLATDAANDFTTEADAEQVIHKIMDLGPEYAAAEYRIVPFSTSPRRPWEPPPDLATMPMRRIEAAYDDFLASLD